MPCFSLSRSSQPVCSHAQRDCGVRRAASQCKLVEELRVPQGRQSFCRIASSFALCFEFQKRQSCQPGLLVRYSGFVESFVLVCVSVQSQNLEQSYCTCAFGTLAVQYALWWFGPSNVQRYLTCSSPAETVHCRSFASFLRLSRFCPCL